MNQKATTTTKKTVKKPIKKATAKKPTAKKPATRAKAKPIGETLKGKTLKEQAAEIIKLAEKSGVKSNYFFITTFNRYQYQLGILEELEKTISENGTLVTKEYVKGRCNIYANPALKEWTRINDSANATVSTLIKIINGFKDGAEEADRDPLMDIINGGDDE